MDLTGTLKEEALAAYKEVQLSPQSKYICISKMSGIACDTSCLSVLSLSRL